MILKGGRVVRPRRLLFGRVTAEIDLPIVEPDVRMPDSIRVGAALGHAFETGRTASLPHVASVLSVRADPHVLPPTVQSISIDVVDVFVRLGRHQKPMEVNYVPSASPLGRTRCIVRPATLAGVPLVSQDTVQVLAVNQGHLSLR